MANHPSAEKRNRQRTKRTDKNRAVRSSVRTAVRKAREAVEAGDKKAAEEAVAVAEKKLARAAQKGVLHKNAAARTSSRMRHALGK
ncbi:MAG: 30S ribosomal protein S20 [Myxococcales bacterium]|nr:30S ribosomal protein S20 [Myxococcales bacterium]MCB9576488.1 30S ribosomal protein S20 [Polyangiaceae bacterium]